MISRLTAPWSRVAWLLAPSAWTAHTAWYLAYRAADYVVVNVSSPNTPGLRDLQAEGFDPVRPAAETARDAALPRALA